MAANYFIFWVYIFLRNPIRNPLFKVFFTIMESFMCIMHIMYFFTIGASMDGDTSSEVELTRWCIYVVMLMMITYTAFSIGTVAFILKNLLEDYKGGKRKGRRV